MGRRELGLLEQGRDFRCVGLAHAEPHVWEIEHDDPVSVGWPGPPGPDNYGHTVAETDYGGRGRAEQEANAALIVALRNAYPPLRAALREKDAELKRLRDYISKDNVKRIDEDLAAASALLGADDDVEAMRLCAESYKRQAEQHHERACRLAEERADALNVKSKDGLLSSEWIARTGKAERERDAALARVKELERALVTFPHEALSGHTGIQRIRHWWREIARAALDDGKGSRVLTAREKIRMEAEVAEKQRVDALDAGKEPADDRAE